MEKLFARYGKRDAMEMIEYLDNYKGAYGKTYKSDYRAILVWVADAVYEKRAKRAKAGIQEDTRPRPPVMRTNSKGELVAVKDVVGKIKKYGNKT
jgi:hypothetical protein